MTKKKHHKTKTKIVYRTAPAPKEVDLTPKLKEEIKDLQSKKSVAPKGFKGILYRAQINKAIYDKSKYIKAKEGTRTLQVGTANLNARIEYERKRAELNELRKKNEVNFNPFGTANSSPKKEIKWNDLI